MADEPILLPCPFCGGLPNPKFDGRSAPILEQVAPELGGGWRVNCYGCGVKTWDCLHRTPEEAVAHWNLRQAPPRPLELPPPVHLSERQRELAYLVSLGLGNKQIAYAMALKEGSVKQYLGQVLEKLNLTNRTELAALWIRTDGKLGLP